MSDNHPSTILLSACKDHIPCMLCRECVSTMRKDRDNPLALSSKKALRGQTDFELEVRRLRADLEAEKRRTLRAGGALSVQLRRLRGAAEREEQRAVGELSARRGCQEPRRHRHLLAEEEVRGKDGGHDSTKKRAFCLLGGESYRKLEKLLLTLYEKINGQHALYKLHQGQEFELEKAILLCHLLETHGRLFQGRQRAGHPSHALKHPSRKPTEGDGRASSKASLQTCHTDSHSAERKAEQRLQSAGRALGAADPHPDTAATCRTSTLEICHPHSAPHAGWDAQLPHRAASSGSDESPPPSEGTIMEVRSPSISRLAELKQEEEKENKTLEDTVQDSEVVLVSNIINYKNPSYKEAAQHRTANYYNRYTQCLCLCTFTIIRADS